MSTDQASGVPPRYATLDPRTRRALAEHMSITACGPGIYRVESQSDAAYIVDLPSRIDDDTNRSSATCTCPDYRTSTQEDDCKHIRCVKLDIAFDSLPEPEETPTENDHIEHEAASSAVADRSKAASVATDGGAIESGDGSADGERPNTTSTDAPKTPSGPDIESAVPDSTTQDVCHQIGARIREIESEVDQYRVELRDLETALSVFEEFQQEQDMIPKKANHQPGA
jgi:hypothetical protein